jgi:hypothetical protein
MSNLEGIFLTPKGPRGVFLQKRSKSAISSSRNPNEFFSHFFVLLPIGSYTRLLGEHVQNVLRHLKLWDYNVWSEKKSFFPLCLVGTTDFDRLWGAKIFNYSILRFCTIVMHIILGTCVPNLRGRWWVEHTQIHPALKKGTKNFHYTSKTCGNFCDFIFLWNKNPNDGYEGPGVI